MNKQRTAGLTGVGVAGAITIIFVYVLKEVTKVELPNEVAQSITVIISFIGGYFGSKQGEKAQNGK